MVKSFERTRMTSRRKSCEDFTEEPLDIQFRDVRSKSGKMSTVPAIHFGFVEKREYVHYQPPATNLNESAEVRPNITSAAQEEWLERMSFIIDDLQWLLRLPHQRFWCQILYDEKLQIFLASFLQKAPRFYDLQNLMISTEMQNSYKMAHRNVFLAYLRMSTYKESKLCHLTKDAFSSYIYDKFLFDIPILLDLCVLYGRDNQAILHKMLENIFMCQPNYKQDLYLAVPTILEAFELIETKMGLRQASSILLKDPNQPDPQISVSGWNELQDLIFYLVDISVNLYYFIDIYPSACQQFQQHQSLFRIASFYETVFDPLEEEIKKRKSNSQESSKLLEEVSKKIFFAKQCLVKTFRDILVWSCIHPLLESEDATPGSGQQFVDSLLQIMGTILTEKRFMCDYETNFPFEEDLEMIRQTHAELDSMQSNFIVKSIRSLMNETVPSKLVNGSLHQNVSLVSMAKKNTYQILNDRKEPEGSLKLEGAASSQRLGGVKLDSLITHVLDFFPDLGDGFVEICLEYFDYEPEKVINCLLEENLPDALKVLDRNLVRGINERPGLVQSKPSGFADLLSERKNIFDNDEMDVFSRSDVDTSRIHKGKKKNTPSAMSTLLDDKQSVRDSKEVYKKYEITTSEYAGLYEDEYDDTYDDATVATWDEGPTPADEVAFGRKFTIPRILRKPGDPDSADEEELEDEEEGVEKPDELEEIPKNENRKEDGRKKEEQPKNFYSSVKGKARGQGQDEKTVQSRRAKEQHKGSYSNHNRKMQAGRKAMGGMMNR